MGVLTKRLRKLEQQAYDSNRLIVLIERYPGQGREQALKEAGLDGINGGDHCVVFIDVDDAGVL
jgi:hypothetical protein